MKKCPTCFNPVDYPRRRIVAGRIVEMCVDACHDKHVNPISSAGEFLAKAKRDFRKASVSRKP